MIESLQDTRAYRVRQIVAEVLAARPLPATIDELDPPSIQELWRKAKAAGIDPQRYLDDARAEQRRTVEAARREAAARR